MDERLFKLPAAIGPRGKVARLGVPAKVLLLSGSGITRPKDYGGGAIESFFTI